MSGTVSSTNGAHHIGMTFPDINAAEDFFVDGLGFTRVGDKPDYPAVFVSDGSIMLTLWQAEDPASAIPFDRRKNIGLHHLALSVANLDEVFAGLRARDDVEIEFPPENLGNSKMRHMMCRIPGNVRLELVQS